MSGLSRFCDAPTAELEDVSRFVNVMFGMNLKHWCKNHRWLKQRWIALFLGSLISCFCLGIAPSTSQTGLTNAEQLVQQGLDRYHAGDLLGAIAHWQQSLPTATHPVEVLKYLARAEQQLGQTDRAIAHLDQAVSHYRQEGNWLQVGRVQTEQAQAYSDSGHYRRAIALLCGDVNEQACTQDTALELARRYSDPLGEAAALGSLGTVSYLQGEYDQALTLLQKSRTIADQTGEKNYTIAIENSLGNLYTSLAQRHYQYSHFAQQAGDQRAGERFRQRAQQADQAAIVAFETSLNLARRHAQRQGELRALLGLTFPYSRQATGKLESLFSQTQATLETLPNSREKATGLIKLAQALDQTRFDTTLASSAHICTAPTPHQTTALLQQAVAIAQTIGDRETEAFALGLMGHAFECATDYPQAAHFTNQAKLTAQNQDTRYLWEWQIGRILRAQGKDAIAEYEQAIRTVSQIQGDIAAANRDLRLDFQATVEAIYRELAEIRLQRAEQTSTSAAQQTQLTLALDTLDQLRVAELQNYLGSECELPLMSRSLTSEDGQIAVFRSVLLSDRIAIILTLPNRNGNTDVRIHWVPIPKATAIQQINEFRQQLEQRADRENAFQANAQEFYNWFIRPFADQLNQQSIKTLVFIQDGILRSLPMAALHDGQQFLIQKYAIANTSSLRLMHSSLPDKQPLQVLAFGLTTASTIDENTFFSPLSAVKSEIDQIQNLIPGSQALMDENFTRQRLQQELQMNHRPVLHLATHAKFGFDARETFLVTGGTTNSKLSSRRFNEILSMNELYQTMRQTQTGQSELDLLTLTGCETAAGSDRDALGIAGVAVQAGAKSAIASLWRVEDEATATLITQFYQHLRTGMSKAEALQAAQTEWLKTYPTGRYNHPGYWAPFILIGNWS